ncbi:unnamed protein product, partial [Urochloa humidicola]
PLRHSPSQNPHPPRSRVFHLLPPLSPYAAAAGPSKRGSDGSILISVSPSSIPLRRSPLPNPSSSHPPRSYLGFPHLPPRHRRRAVQEGSAATMLQLELKKESRFLNVLEAILDLVDVASVHCSSTGLKLQAMDTEREAIISLLFPTNDFLLYSCDKEHSMGISIDEMVKVIRCAEKDDTITIKVDDEIYETITLSFKSPKGNDTLSYDLWLVDASDQRFLIPDWGVLESFYQAFVKMPSAEFMHVCKSLSNISYDGDISVTEEGLQFVASGKSGCVKIKYKEPEEAIPKFVTMRASLSMTLDLKYMKYSAKVSTLFDEVKICLSTTQLEYKMEESGYIRYFLVPKAQKEIEKENIKKR